MMVNTLLKLCSPFLKEANSALITTIACGSFHKTNIGHLDNYGLNNPNRSKMEPKY